MKNTKYFAGLFCLMLLFSANVFAQKDMSMDEWEAEMSRLNALKVDQKAEIAKIQPEVKELKDELATLQTYEECIDELYALVGATEADVDRFRKEVAILDGKIKRKEGPKDDRQVELDGLKANKISALPEFFDKVHNQMQRALDAWIEAPKEIMYTVVKGDHLWGIAKKKEHYDNPFAWPVIYKSNRDQIKNPDLIYPKQIFKIPNLTEEEKARYEKARKNYKPAPPTQN